MHIVAMVGSLPWCMYWENFLFYRYFSIAKKFFLKEFGTQFFIFFSFCTSSIWLEDEDDDNPYALWMPQSAHQSCPGIWGTMLMFVTSIRNKARASAILICKEVARKKRICFARKSLQKEDYVFTNFLFAFRF